MHVKNELESLLNYHNLRHHFLNPNSLIIQSNKNDRDLKVQFGQKEHMLIISDWHWHFENDLAGNSELLDLIRKIIGNTTYIKIYKKNKRAYKTELVLDLPNDYELNNLKVSFFSFDLFTKPQIEYSKFYFK